MNQSSKPDAIRLERVIPARTSDVYRAWLDPETLCRWLAPGGIRTDRAEVDERAGGHYRIWHSAGEANVGGFDCEILELTPNKQIVFRWGFIGPARTKGPVYDSLLTITLRPGPGGTTRLTLLHERLGDLAAALPHVADQVVIGWGSVLDKLVTVMSAAQENHRCAR